MSRKILAICVLTALVPLLAYANGKTESTAKSGSAFQANYTSADYSESSPIVAGPTLGVVNMGPATKTPVSLPYGDVLPLPEGPVGDAGRTYTIGLSLPFTTNIWFLGVQDSALIEAQRHPNVKILVRNANQDATQQANDIQALISQHVDGIIVDPLQEAALVPAMRRAMQVGIPVVDVDRQLTQPAYTNVVTGDFSQGPRDLAKWVVEQLRQKYGEPKGIIAEIQTDMGSTPQIARFNAFKTVVDQYPGIKIVGLQSAKSDETLAYDVMKDILSANPNLDVVYTHSEDMTMGAWKAMDAAGKANGVLFLGCDLSKEGVKWIKDGRLSALAAWTPYMGDVALRALFYDLGGKPVPKTIWLPDQPVATKGTVDQYGGSAYGPVPQGMESYWTVGKQPGQ